MIKMRDFNKKSLFCILFLTCFIVSSFSSIPISYGDTESWVKDVTDYTDIPYNLRNPVYGNYSGEEYYAYAYISSSNLVLKIVSMSNSSVVNSYLITLTELIGGSSYLYDYSLNLYNSPNNTKIEIFYVIIALGKINIGKQTFDLATLSFTSNTYHSVPKTDIIWGDYSIHESYNDLNVDSILWGNYFIYDGDKVGCAVILNCEPRFYKPPSSNMDVEGHILCIIDDIQPIINTVFKTTQISYLAIGTYSTNIIGLIGEIATDNVQIFYVPINGGTINFSTSYDYYFEPLFGGEVTSIWGEREERYIINSNNVKIFMNMPHGVKVYSNQITFYYSISNNEEAYTNNAHFYFDGSYDITSVTNSITYIISGGDTLPATFINLESDLDETGVLLWYNFNTNTYLHIFWSMMAFDNELVYAPFSLEGINNYFHNQKLFCEKSIGKINIYYTTSEEEFTPPIIVNPSTAPYPSGFDDTKFPAWYESETNKMIDIIIPLIFILIPALMFAVFFGGMGLIVGALLGSIAGTIAGVIPSWAFVILLVGIVAMLFVGRNRSGNSGVNE